MTGPATRQDHHRRGPGTGPASAARGECAKIRGVVARVGDKWSVLVIMLLRGGPLRFGEIKRAVEDVSQRMLTLTLRGLERDGLVARTVTPSLPPRVDYELTALGRSLAEPVEALGRWAALHLDEVDGARADYDGRREAEAAPRRFPAAAALDPFPTPHRRPPR